MRRVVLLVCKQTDNHELDHGPRDGVKDEIRDAQRRGCVFIHQWSTD